MDCHSTICLWISINMAKKKSSKTANGNHFALPHLILDHPDYLKMSWASQSLLNHIGRFFNGYNNGDLSIAESVMKLRGWSSGTLNKSKKELLINDWIRLTRQGGRTKIPSLFALSWLPLGNVKPKLDICVKSYRIRKL